MPDLPHLNLIVIRSAEPETSVQFYKSLGLNFIQHRHSNGPEHYSHETPSLTFEIYPQTKPDQTTTATRLGFQVANLDALVAQLSTQNIPILLPPTDSPWGRRAIILDPDGHTIELVGSAQTPSADSSL